jgi:hypothetical protein
MTILPYNYATDNASTLKEIKPTGSARVIQFIPLSSVSWQQIYQKPYGTKVQGDTLQRLCSIDFDVTETTSGRTAGGMQQSNHVNSNE